MGSNKGGTHLGNWLVVLVVVICILALGGLALPATTRLRERARESEVKANLHSIQLALEKYGQNMGRYPAYLIGGEARCAQQVVLAYNGAWAIFNAKGTEPGYPAVAKGQSSAQAVKPSFSEIVECERADVSDPLLRLGYLDAYPRNPFAGDGQAIHWMQEYRATSATGNDPLRNAAAEGAALGTRFGAQCTAMGQVLCDPRYPRWLYSDPATGASEPRDSWATVEYRFWDMWLDLRGREPYLPFSPGQFFYKSLGSYVAIQGDSSVTPQIPESCDQYMLGAYGSLHTKGKDVIGEEQPIFYRLRINKEESGDQASDKQIGFATQELVVWPWTRSVLGSQNKAGSPFGSGDCGDSNEQMCYGHPNGIPDGLILIRTAGEDY